MTQIYHKVLILQMISKNKMLSHCIPLQPTLPHTCVVARLLTILSYVLICYYISYILILVVTLLEELFSHINEALQLMKKYLLAEIKAVMFMEKNLHAKTSSFMIFT